MQQIVTITSQGQLTVPKSIRKALGIKDSTKVLIKKEGKKIIVEPKSDFWSLKGALKSKVVLSDKDLKKARQTFAKNWGRTWKK